MNKAGRFLVFFGILIFSFMAFAMNGRTTYQAKIVKPDGQPLQATSVNFRFSVLDTVGSCVLYVEDYAAVNMNDSGGLISFALGSGTRSFPTSGTSQTFQNVFSNSVTSFSCQAPGIYSPGPNDVRKVVMQFNDGSGWQTLPAMTINAVPYAMYADKANDSRTLNGKADTAFVENSTLAALNCNPATHAITFNGVSFSCIPVGSSSSGITSVTTSGTVLSTGGTASAPVISIQAATVSQDGYLTSLDYAEFKAKLSASSTQIINTLGYTPVSSSAVATQIGNSNLSGDVSGTVSANSVVSVGGKSAAQISASVDDTLAATSSATADTIVKRNSLGHVTVNDLYATAAKVNYVDIYKPSTSFNIRLQAPTSLSANYTLTLPNNTGVSGQVIATDGSGNLSWVNAATGSVTSVSAIAPLASTGGATPTISITQATSSTAGYLSSADWTTFNNKQQATSSAIIATLGYTPADNAVSGTYVHKANNLSDLVSSATARMNLGLGTLATANSIDLGSASATGIIADARLATQSNVTSGAQYTKVTVDGKGRVTSGAQLSSSDVTTALGYTPANDSASGTYLVKASNLSDLTNIPQARNNLGLGGFATISSLDLGSASATGTLDIARLPSFAGDATIAAASNTIILSNSGVTAGTYTKVTVDGKGRVTSGAQLVSSDVTTALGYTPAASGSFTSSQWVTSATSIYYNAGNVGIGTVSPWQKFDVSGSAVVNLLHLGIGRSVGGYNSISEASTGTKGKILFGADNSDQAAIYSEVASGAVTGLVFEIKDDPTDYFSFNNQSGPVMRLYQDGMMGLGVQNPSAVLHLKAGTSATASLKLTSGTLLSTPQLGTMEYDGTDFYLTDGTGVRRVISTGSNTSAIDDIANINNSSGNITLTPGGGSVIVSATTASTNSSTGALVVKGGLGMAGTANIGGNLNVSGSAQVSSFFGATNLFYLNASGAAYTDASAAYAGAERGLSVDVGSNTAWNLAKFKNASGTAMLIQGNGNVGIGTTNPQGRFSIENHTGQNATALYINRDGVATGVSTTQRGIYLKQISSNDAVVNEGLYIDVAHNIGNDATAISAKASTVYTMGAAISATATKSIGAGGGLVYAVKAVVNSPDANTAGALYAGYFSNVASGGSNLYGVYINNPNVAATNYGLYQAGGTQNYFSGSLGIGTASPAHPLQVHAAGTSSLLLSTGADDSRLYLTDTNRSIRGIAGGALAVHTGGSERVRIDSAGNIGVGTTNPQAKFGIVGTRQNTITPSNAIFKFGGDDVFLYGGAHNGVGGPNYPIMLQAMRDSDSVVFPIVLNPNGGNVGVGTATPTAPLSVSGMIRSDSAAANFSFIGNAGGSNLQIYHPAAGAARVFNSGGDIALQVDSGGTATGNVGIGTSSPAYTLHAAGNIVADRPLSHPYGLGVRTDSTWTVWKRQFAFFSNDGSQLGGLTAHGSTGNTLDRISIGQGLDTSGANGTEWLTVKSNGNVGIGTSAPDKNLTIHSTGLDNYIHLTSSMTGTTLSDGVMIGTGTAGDAAFYNRESTNMIFLTSNTERVRIDPAGKVGIGITTPSQALDVNGYVQSYSDFYDVKTFADGWVIGDYAEVVQAAPAGAAGNSNIIRVSMATTRGNWVESSTYDLVSAHSESDVWREIPATSVNYYTTFTYRCFTVDANGFGGVVKFRIRAIQNSSNCSAASTGSLPIYFKAQVFGHNSGWTKLTSTGTGATVTGYRSSVGSEWNLYTGASRNAGLPTITAKEGSVGIGTTAPTAKLDVNGSIKFGSSALISPAVDNSQLRSNYIPATDQLVDTARSSWAIVAGNSGDQFSIYRAPAAGGSPIYSQLYYQSGNGNAWMAGTLTQASDRRLKKDIVTIQDSLRRINELDGVTYYWIDKNRDNAEQIGLIAQDVEKVFPQAVKTRSDGFKSVAYSALIAPVINAVKELYTKFIGHDQQLEKQQREIASLKAENTEIKKQYLDVQKYICRKDPKADFCKQQ